ncbi:N-acetylglucosamine-6-phosphate deacetylase [Populibacterium corticicola]|uniref:N-acetylglucosamine-6-phosphate deacetylase n=1 Tax=Populibacterium corticicola TaxID=1812826 RepID=A0ABW5XFP4_9MICO
MTFVLRAPRIHTGQRVLDDAWLAVSESRVVALGSGPVSAEFSEAPVHDVPGTVVPGYIDIHCHGGGGGSFAGSGEAALTAARTALRTHLQHGTTTMVASLVTGIVDDLASTVRTLGPLVDSGELAGIHLEGPWLSVAHKGAHEPTLLIPPTEQDIATIFDAHPGAVKMVTIAPEVEGGMEAVRNFVARGAIAAIGHTDASYDDAAAAIDEGVTNVTHLFNAMNPIHHRIPGPIIKLLEDDRVTVELICDGVHLHPAIIKHAVTAAGKGRVIFVTDSMDATDMADGDYVLGSLEVRVENGVARLKSNGAIAGSTLTMERAVQYAVTEAGVDLGDALAAATTTPAAALGRTDIGHLEAGALADIVILDEGLNVSQVYRRGELAVER